MLIMFSVVKIIKQQQSAGLSIIKDIMHICMLAKEILEIGGPLASIIYDEL